MEPPFVAATMDITRWMSDLAPEFETKLKETGIPRPKGVGRVLWAFMFLKEFNFVPPVETALILKERTAAVKNDLVDLALIKNPEEYLIREADREHSPEKLKGTALNRLSQVADFFKDPELSRTLDHAQAWLFGSSFELEEKHVLETMKTQVADTVVKYVVTGVPSKEPVSLESFVRLSDIGPYPNEAEHEMVDPREVLSKDEVNELVSSMARCRNRYEAQTNVFLTEIHKKRFQRATFKEFVIRIVLYYWREIEATREFSGWSVLNEFPWAREVREIMQCSKRCQLMKEKPLRAPESKSSIIFGEEHKRMRASYKINEAPLSQRRRMVGADQYPVWADAETTCYVAVPKGKDFTAVRAQTGHWRQKDDQNNRAFFLWRQQNPKAWCHFPEEESKRQDFFKEAQKAGLGF